MPLPPLPIDPEIGLLAAKMKELRAASKLTYEELAERTGMSRRGIISYEQGETNGTLRHWYRIAKALDVSFSDFVSPLK